MSWTAPPLPLADLLLAMMLTLVGLGLGLSALIERRGLPSGLNVQRVKRKPGALRSRLPLIALNLTLMLGGAWPTLRLVAPALPFLAPTALDAAVLLALIVVDDLGFYFFHRALHQDKRLYRLIHRVHHQAYAPAPIEFIYVHPLEWVLGAALPVGAMVGVVLALGHLNAWVFLAWVGWRTLHELDIHSGTRSGLFDRLPLFAPARHHDLHHARPNDGNYASMLVLWDRLLGTEIRPDPPRRA